MTNKQQGQKKGFTIVELIVVIIVIGILVSVVIVGYGQWRKSIATKAVQSDLTAAAAAMDSARTFGTTGYPTAIPASATPSPSVLFNGGGRPGGAGFCINGTSTTDATISYYVSDKQKSPAQGNCTITATQVISLPIRVEGLALGSDGSIYIPDDTTPSVRKVTPAGVATTYAGTGVNGYVDGPAATAQFKDPRGTAVGPDGSVYVADINGNAIRKISPSMTVSTFSQSSIHATDVMMGVNGSTVYALSGDNLAGGLYSLTASGVVTKLAGGATNATVDGTGLAASFNDPRALTQMPDGTIYVCETGSGLIRKVTTATVVTTYAGPSSAYSGGATSPLAGWCSGVAATTGSSGVLYVIAGGKLQSIDKTGTVTTLASTCASGSSGLAIDSSGNLWVSGGTASVCKITIP